MIVYNIFADKTVKQEKIISAQASDVSFELGYSCEMLIVPQGRRANMSRTTSIVTAAAS